jgi:hypothetical protein
MASPSVFEIDFNIPVFGPHQDDYNIISEQAATAATPTHAQVHSIVQESYDDYYDPRFPHFLSPTLLVIGLFGNLLSVWVFSRPSMRRNSTFIYLLFLCIVDLLVLLFGLGDIVVFSYTRFVVREQSLLVCRVHTFLTYMFTHLSSFILASVSIERAIATNLITFAKDYCKPRTAYRVLALNLLLASLPNSHYLMFLGYEQSILSPNATSNLSSSSDTTNGSDTAAAYTRRVQCTAPPDSAYERFLNPFYNWMDVIFYAILPFLIMAVCSFFIIRVIFSSNKRMERSLSMRTSTAILNATIINRVPENARRTSSTSNNNTNTTSTESPLLLKEGSIRQAEKKHSTTSLMLKRLVSSSGEKKPPNTARMNKTLHLTYTLISINTLFFLLVSPLVILASVVNEKTDIQKTKILYNIVYLLAYSNHSLNFVFYGLSSPPYRETIQSLFAAKKKSLASFRRATLILDNKT